LGAAASEKRSAGAGKHAQDEENVTTGDAPQKKGKWADLPTCTSHRYVFHTSFLSQMTEHWILVFIKMGMSTQVSVKGSRGTWGIPTKDQASIRS